MLKNLIAPSRILPKVNRDFVSLTRARESLVKIRSQTENRILQELETAFYQIYISAYPMLSENQEDISLKDFLTELI